MACGPSSTSSTVCLTDNRDGLVVDIELAETDRDAQRDVALVMLKQRSLPGARCRVIGMAIVAADWAYHTVRFV